MLLQEITWFPVLIFSTKIFRYHPKNNEKLFNMKVDFYNWQHNTLTQAHLCYCRLIINSSLPIGCQFIWETKLTLKSQMILEKSWWSCLVVAIVFAVFIAVVIVNVWSSPNLPICFHFLWQPLGPLGQATHHGFPRTTHPEVSWSGANSTKKKRRRRR